MGGVRRGKFNGKKDKYKIVGVRIFWAKLECLLNRVSYSESNGSASSIVKSHQFSPPGKFKLVAFP